MLEKINYKDIFTKTNLIITLFGVLPLAGYLIGTSFYQGRLAAYGISSDTFPLSLQDTYIEAYYAVGLLFTKQVANFLTVISTPPGIYWLGASIAIVILTLFFSIKQTSKKHLSIERFQSIKKVIDYLHWEKNAFTKAIGIAGVLSYQLLIIFWLVLVIAICWFAAPRAAYFEGRDLYTAKINSYLEKGCHAKDGEKWSNCTVLKTSDDKQIYEGILVAHANGYVAFFNKTGSFVAKFPENGVMVSVLSNDASIE